jgi:hypothetical protein
MKDDFHKIANEISHLSPEQIEELYQKYIAGEKNSILVKQYNINVHPNKLIKILPPVRLTEYLCPHCKIPMYTNRKGKNGWETPPIECHACEHTIFLSQNSLNRCLCEKCISTRKEEKIEREQKQRNAIRSIYSLDRVEPIKYSELSFFNKLILLTLFRMQTSEEFNHILSLDDPSRTELLSPTEQMDIECLNELFNTGAITIDPESDIKAFLEEEEFKSFYLSKTRWIPNVTLSGIERASLTELYNEIYYELLEGLQPHWENEVFNTLFRISREEVLKYVYISAEELRIDFTAENKTREVATQLLHNFSVSEIYYFAKKSVENAHLYYSKGLASNKKHAANTIPNKMLSLGERAQNENWNTYKYNRDSRAPRSYLSKIFYDFLLGDEDSGFSKSPGKQWEQELYPRHFCNKKSSIHSEPRCTECNSLNMAIMMHGETIEINCKNCGHSNEFTSTK